MHRARTKDRANRVAKEHVEMSKIRMLRRGLTPPTHGLEERNGFATFKSHEASPAAGPGPGAYHTELHKSIGRGVHGDNNEGATAPAYSILTRRD